MVLGLTSLAILLTTTGQLALALRQRTAAAQQRVAAQTQRLTAAGVPLLVNALVVGDLATAEQTIRSLNSDLVWERVRLYEPEGQRLILDASPAERLPSRVPRWVAPLVAVHLPETQIPLVAGSVLYGRLAVVPSSQSLESELWTDVRHAIGVSALLLVVLLVLINAILVYGFRPVRVLAERATRFGQGDLSARMPETTLAEIAPTVRAFNEMAANLERVLGELRTQEIAHRRLAAIVEQSEEAILTIDLDRRITSWNRGARRTLGRSEEATVGQPLNALIAAEGADGDREVARLLDTRPPARLDTTLRRGAEVLPVAAAASPLHDEQGRQTGHIIVARDITERKRAEAELRRAMEEAEAASRAKAEFLATMSHEIRTPMNGIMGMTDLVLDTELTREQREYLGLVKLSAHALLAVINDVLDFSKIDAGRIELEHIDFSLRGTLDHALKVLAVRAHEQGLELAAVVAPDVVDGLVGDPGRLRQVLVNLVGNALKFTPAGEVVVTVRMASEAADGVELHFAVRDTGIGIAPVKQQAIFQAFTQADSSMTRRYGGTGLGLAISRRLVELMGGRIWVESEEGQGSTFHFTVRFGVAAVQPPPASADLARLRGHRVLVVDDNATNRRILEEVLAHAGLRPTVVNDADAALNALRAAAARGELPPFLVTDLQMPGLDGLELAERVAADPALAGIAIILLTSAGMPGDAARSRQAGVRAYLTKPVAHAELLQALVTALDTTARERHGDRPLVTRHALREQRRRLRVLLAEDNAVNQLLTLRLLERLGHHAVAVTDGRAALAAHAAELFDLVIMDVQMPEMDGLEAARAIRATEAARGDAERGRVPIIALTAHAMKTDEARCLDAGMDAYLSKPVSSAALAEAMDRLLPARAAAGPRDPDPVPRRLP
jgi:PAS domain S-box-containing protein